MTAERFGAVVRLVCTLVCGVAAVFGASIDADVLTEGVFCAAALVCLLITWWKNNNVTEAACTAQKLLDALKDGDVTDFIVESEDSVDEESEGDEFTASNSVPTDEWTKAELLEWCEAHGVEAYKSWSKTKIMIAIANSGECAVDLSGIEVEE